MPSFPVSCRGAPFPIRDNVRLRAHADLIDTLAVLYQPWSRPMPLSLSRRELLQAAAVSCVAALPTGAAEARSNRRAEVRSGWVSGKMTGAEALVETLLLEGVQCVFGIPGAQNNELWDTLKAKGMSYVLVTH